MTKRKLNFIYLISAGLFLLDFVLLAVIELFSSSEVLLYLADLFDLFLTIFLPSLCVCGAIVRYGKVKYVKTLLCSLFATLPTLARALPALVLDSVVDGYEFSEALILGAIYAVAIYVVHVLFSSVLMMTAGKITSVRGAIMPVRDSFDFSKPSNLVFALVASVPFLFFFIYEIYSIIVFTSQYFDSLSVSEIVTMALRFVIIPAFYLLSVYLIPKILFGKEKKA